MKHLPTKTFGPPCIWISNDVLDIDVHTSGTRETVAVFVASFLAFNLRHSKKQESTIEAMEGLLGIRKSFSKAASKQLCRLFK